MMIVPQFELGAMVYLKTDDEQLLRIVTGIFIRPSGITYELSQSTRSSNHYDFEISFNKTLVNI